MVRIVSIDEGPSLDLLGELVVFFPAQGLHQQVSQLSFGFDPLDHHDPLVVLHELVEMPIFYVGMFRPWMKAVFFGNFESSRVVFMDSTMNF